MKMLQTDDGDIRVFFTKQDFESYNVTLTDFITISDKMRELFRNILEIADKRYHFRPKNDSLSIGAIPLGEDRFVLTFSNRSTAAGAILPAATDEPASEEHSLTIRPDDVEFVDDLVKEEPTLPMPQDSRRGRRTPARRDTDTPEEEDEDEELLRENRRVDEMITRFYSRSDEETRDDSDEVSEDDFYRVFNFQHLENLLAFAKASESYKIDSLLLYDSVEHCYHLCLMQDPSASDPEAEYLRAASVAAEYGTPAPNPSILYYVEHFPCIAKHGALEMLRGL
ncbi:MAG: adaptor protein MecA [Lachnospiraceae bacterium]|nr:adaptor protein MecA [Lachnospiraceae bacterium]